MSHCKRIKSDDLGDASSCRRACAYLHNALVGHAREHLVLLVVIRVENGAERDLNIIIGLSGEQTRNQQSTESANSNLVCGVPADDLAGFRVPILRNENRAESAKKPWTNTTVL
jgi:hypothetical protein